METPEVEVRRSARRRRTVSARREGDRIVVLVPAALTRAEEEQWVATMVERLQTRAAKPRRTDADLLARSRRLSETYLGGLARPSSVRWVRNQRGRWGSCTPSDGTIRLSHRLEGMPAYVVDYVLLHELAHLLVPGHGPQFWAVLAGFPPLDRARGFLDGVAMATGLDLDEGDGELDDTDAQAVGSA